MKNSGKILDKDIFIKPEFSDPKKYTKRITVKAIVENEKNEFAFITNNIHKIILLPGGGAGGDGLKKEINRECEEEIFYSLKNIKELFEVQEFRNRNAKEYRTICFYGEIDKKSEIDTRTEDEKKNGLKVVWLKKEDALKVLEKQVSLLKEGKVKFYNTAFNILRDYNFFKKYLEEKKKWF